MDSLLQDYTIEEQRGVVRFLWAEGVKPVEIHRRMLTQYGQNEKFMSGWKGLNRVERVLLMKVVLVGHQHRAAERFFSAGIQKLVVRYNKCIVLQGAYVEK